MIRALQPLARREFRLLTLATLVSVLGDGLLRVALPLQVLAITDDDPLAIGAVGLAWTLGHLTSLPLGGLASDRRDRRDVMIGSDVVRAAAIGGIAVLGMTGALELWHVLVLGALFGLANGFFNPAARSLVPQLLPDDELPRANALLGVARPVQLWIVGPLLAGLLIAVASPGLALGVDALSFVVSAAMLAGLTRRPPAAAVTSPLDDLREGARFVRSTRWAIIWFLASGLSTMAFHGPFDVLIPTMLKVDLGLTEAEAGWWIAVIFASGGAGALLGSTFIGQRDLPRRFMLALYLVEATTLFGLAAFAYVSRLWHVAGLGFVVFGAAVVSEIISETNLQLRVPPALLGRVTSLEWFVAIGLAPVSFALAGPLGRAFGARAVLAAAGVAGGVAVLAFVIAPGARDPERMRGRAAVAPVAADARDRPPATHGTT